VIPEAMFRLGEVYQGDGRTEDAQRLFRQVAEEYPYTDWGKRAAQRLQTATR
jgi:TolA-binding protein